MSSFYGGKPGKDFRIAKVFNNKAEMISDLQQKWTSSIPVGEYVFINYGDSSNGTIEYKENETVNINGQIYTYPKDMSRYERNRYIDETCIIGTEADGKLYNTTLWVKKYTKDGQTLDDFGYLDKYLVSEDSGLGYYLIASLKGAVPIIDVQYEVINNNKDPYIIVDNSNAESPIYTFCLPRTVKIFFGEDLIYKNSTYEFNYPNEEISTYAQFADLDITDFHEGDFYINSNNGNIWKAHIYKNGTQAFLRFEYQGCVARTNPKASTKKITPYKDASGTVNPPSVTSTMTDSTWNFEFSLPTVPKFTVKAETVAPTGQVAVSQTISNGTDSSIIQNTFSIPRGSLWLTGNVNPNTITTSALSGDYYLNKATGEIYYYSGNSWTDTTINITGPQGMRGTQWFTGGTAPSTSLSSIIGDYFLADDGQVYSYSGTTWNATTVNLIGPKGDKGDQGIQGIQGEKGDKGDQGIQGIQGVKGDKGDKGDIGLTGATGEKGDKGDTGDPLNFLTYITYIYDENTSSSSTGDHEYTGNASMINRADVTVLGNLLSKELGLEIATSDIIVVTYKVDDDISTYWLTLTEEGWESSKVTGSGANGDFQSLAKDITIAAGAESTVVVTDSAWAIRATGNETLIVLNNDNGIISSVVLDEDTGTITLSIGATPNEDVTVRAVLIR